MLMFTLMKQLVNKTAKKLFARLILNTSNGRQKLRVADSCPKKQKAGPSKAPARPAGEHHA